MNYTPRTIALVCELLHPPMPPDAGKVQKLHNKMFESGNPAWSSFAVTPVGALLSNPATQPGYVSQVAFLADRVQFREELGAMTPGEFAERVEYVAQAASDLCAIPLYTAQQVTVRSLVNPKHYKDSREFIREAMFGMDEEVQIFERKPQLYGMRLVFPPDPEHGAANAFAVRIESFSSDSRSIYVENQGTFPPIPMPDGIPAVGQAVHSTYEFLVKRALTFVEDFDAQPPPPAE